MLVITGLAPLHLEAWYPSTWNSIKGGVHEEVVIYFWQALVVGAHAFRMPVSSKNVLSIGMVGGVLADMIGGVVAGTHGGGLRLAQFLIGGEKSF